MVYRTREVGSIDIENKLEHMRIVLLINVCVLE